MTKINFSRERVDITLKSSRVILFGWLIILTLPGLTAAESGEPPSLTGVDPSELLETGPVDGFYTEPASGPKVSSPSDDDLLSGKQTSGEVPYPIAGPAPEVQTAREQPSALSQQINTRSLWFSYYYPSAYIPPAGQTEVELGLVVNPSPGIVAALEWGAMEELMLMTRVKVQSASYTAGLGLRYMLIPEMRKEPQPAISALLSWRYLNHRTTDEERENIYLGNRIQTGMAFSKKLGALAHSLQANQAVETFLNYFGIHVEILAEFQTGREGVSEAEVSRLEFGTRAAWEIAVDPGKLFISLIYDSLPDWLGEENLYAGVRYFARPEFAMDVLAGRMGSDLGITLALVWVF